MVPGYAAPDTPMTPQIRRFLPTDRAGLIQAIDAVCSEGRWMRTTHFEPTPAWTHALERPNCPDHLLLVVVDAGRVVGWCRIFPRENRQGAREATLGIGLLPAYRDRGIGSTLVRRSLRWARDSGYRRVLLTTHPDNARAIHVFGRCGFVPIGMARDSSVEMACNLSLLSYA